MTAVSEKDGSSDDTWSAKTSIQCRKCQRWGHSASNCFAKDPKCVKCAESHATHNCRKEDSRPRYQSAKDKAAAAARKQQPRNAPRRDPARSYQPAPIPAINPWRQPPSDPPQTANGAAAGTDFPPLGSTEKVTRIALSNALDARPTQPLARLTSTPTEPVSTPPTEQVSHRTAPPRAQTPPAEPGRHHPETSTSATLPTGWTRLSQIISRINTELDIGWIATQLDIFHNTIKATADPFAHIAAVAAYQEAISNGRRH
ncbi:hypothetical protein QE152_g39836 [Popillia japonica]|uniref:Gag protein n=1 Tax=Popillia japonica TaxID=7064 RepID=A0AAW1HT03_POPJA